MEDLGVMAGVRKIRQLIAVEDESILNSHYNPYVAFRT